MSSENNLGGFGEENTDPKVILRRHSKKVREVPVDSEAGQAFVDDFGIDLAEGQEKVKLEHPEYKGLSPEGVELGKQRGVELAEEMLHGPDGLVHIEIGATDQIRTHSTAETVVEGAKQALEGNFDDVHVITKQDLEARFPRTSAGVAVDTRHAMKDLAEQIKADPNGKYIIGGTFNLKEMASGMWFTDEAEAYNLNGIKEGDFDSAMKDWTERDGGDIEGVPAPQKPMEAARLYKAAILRTLRIVQGYLGKDRPLQLGITGHSIVTDAFISHAAQEGQLNMDEAYLKASDGKGIINETEAAEIRLEGNHMIVSYRGAEFVLDIEEDEAA